MYAYLWNIKNKAKPKTELIKQIGGCQTWGGMVGMGQGRGEKMGEGGQKLQASSYILPRKNKHEDIMYWGYSV